MSIDLDVKTVLIALANNKQIEIDSAKGRYTLEGNEIASITNLAPEKINDAVEILEENGYIDVTKTFGTTPYNFKWVELTARGRLEAERLEEEKKGINSDNRKEINLNILPVGSPYGFTDYDWASVMNDRKNQKTLIVGFGYKWDSTFYNSSHLIRNIKSLFNKGLEEVSAKSNIDFILEFRIFQGAYGGHLFNQIACDIIGSDIIILDTSDQNPNVMIEMGVSLTWGKSILPIREKSAPKPPSDISGHTWAEYENNGDKWLDPEHYNKIVKMIKIAMSKKSPIRF